MKIHCTAALDKRTYSDRAVTSDLDDSNLVGNSLDIIVGVVAVGLVLGLPDKGKTSNPMVSISARPSPVVEVVASKIRMYCRSY